MTRLRQMMLEELERRNYSPEPSSVPSVRWRILPATFIVLPTAWAPAHPRGQAYLFRQRKLAPSSVTQRLAALRFFFIKTLKRSWSVAETPIPSRAASTHGTEQEEVSRLINSARNPFDRVLLMTLYATGARRAEVTRLKVSDIDSQRMVIYIQGGKA